MKFVVTINTENAAFEDDSLDKDARNTEVARMLRQVAERLEDAEVSQLLRDINGNTCGVAEFKDE